MTTRNDYARILKPSKDSELLYARGFLTITVTGLTKTKDGRFRVPLFRIDEDGNLQNFHKNSSGSPYPLYTFAGDGIEKRLKQPRMFGETKEKRLLLWVNENGKDLFFALDAWDLQAQNLNMFYKKGDQVCILAKRNTTILPGGEPMALWNIQEICKITKDESSAMSPSFLQKELLTVAGNLLDFARHINEEE